MLLLALATSLVMADPPARVGRLAHLENQVSFRVDRSTERGAATINWPISSGAILDTDWRGRAEVWIGSSAFRLAGNSELEFVQVDDQQINLKVSVGSLAISIMDNDQLNELSVTTPEGTTVRFPRLAEIPDTVVLPLSVSVAALVVTTRSPAISGNVREVASGVQPPGAFQMPLAPPLHVNVSGVWAKETPTVRKVAAATSH